MTWIAYQKAKSLNEALTLLERAAGKGRVIAGGTDLILQLKQGQYYADFLVDISGIEGLTLPGIIELPGSFSGREISPIPQRGPDPSHRISLAIFISAQARVFKEPLAITTGSCAAKAANLLCAERNLILVISGM